MNVIDERTRSLWMETELPKAPALDSNASADAVIIGSGIAGLSVAYELSARGLSVIVVDRGRICGGMTCRTTAHLSSSLDDFYSELIKVRNEDVARLLHESLVASIDRAEAIQAQEGIACDFARLDGHLFRAPNTPANDLHTEFEACRKIGVEVSESHEPLPFTVKDGMLSLRFARQGRFHPLKYLNGLAAAAQKRGARLFADTCVESVEEKNGAVLARTAAGHELRASELVVATNSPIIDRVAVHSKQAPYRTYVIVAKLPRGSIPDALYWDTLEAYHYLRLQPLSDTHDALIIGGEDHKSGEANDGADRFSKLEEWARTRLPLMQEVTHRWSGQVLEPVDYCGFVGRNPGNEHVYMVSGDSGQGITNGIVAGMLISDLVTRGGSPWAEVYDPGRKVAGSLGEYVSENLTPLKNFTEYVTAGDFECTKDLKPGEGGLYRKGIHKLAVSRDLDGMLHMHSATCTHLGCVVHWNTTEQCWDCPCHGSQFAPDGTVLNGPAIRALGETE